MALQQQQCPTIGGCGDPLDFELTETFARCGHAYHRNCLTRLGRHWVDALQFECPMCHPGSIGHPTHCQPCGSWLRDRKCSALKAGKCTRCHLDHEVRGEKRPDKRGRRLQDLQKMISSNGAGELAAGACYGSVQPVPPWWSHGLFGSSSLVAALVIGVFCWHRGHVATLLSPRRLSHSIPHDPELVCPSILRFHNVDGNECCDIIPKLKNTFTPNRWEVECINLFTAVLDKSWSFSDPTSYFCDFQPPKHLKHNASVWSEFAYPIAMMDVPHAQPEDHIHRCRLLLKLADYYYYQEDARRAWALQYRSRLISEFLDVKTESLRCSAAAMTMEGTLLYEDRNDLASGAARLFEAMQLLDRHGMRDEPDYADTLIQHAKVMMLSGNYAQASRELQSAESLKNELIRKHNGTAGSMYCNLVGLFAHCHLHDGQFPLAEQRFREASSCFHRVKSDGAMTHFGLAKTLAWAGRLDDALIALDEISSAPIAEWSVSVLALVAVCQGDIAVHRAYESSNMQLLGHADEAYKEAQRIYMNFAHVDSRVLSCVEDRLNSLLDVQRGYHMPLRRPCDCQHRI